MKLVEEKNTTTPIEKPKGFVKDKRVRIIVIIFIILLFVSGIILGYLYYTQLRLNKSLSLEKQDLIKTRDELNLQLEQLKGVQIEPDEQDQSEVENLEAKIAIAVSYNEFFKYLNSVIDYHDGFTGWTEEEYQHARVLAQKTGNPNFLFIVDEAWNNDQEPVLPRLLAVWEAIRQGIETSLD